MLYKYHVSKRVDVITGSVNLDQINTKANFSVPFSDLPLSAKMVLSCGWLSWHKGADFFIQTAIQVLKHDPDVHFCWLGSPGPDDENMLANFKYDLFKAGIDKNVHHINSQISALAYFKRADLLLMLSRDESFSIVTVEAGSLKIPVLCFENSGGPCEILENTPELIIPYGDISLLSAKVVELLNDDQKRTELGNRLFEEINLRYTIETTGPQFLSLINSI